MEFWNQANEALLPIGNLWKIIAMWNSIQHFFYQHAFDNAICHKLTKWLWLHILMKSYAALGYHVCVNTFWWISESKDCACFLHKTLGSRISISLQPISSDWRHMETHIVVNIVSDNGAMPVRRQAITLTYTDALSLYSWKQTWDLNPDGFAVSAFEWKRGPPINGYISVAEICETCK